MNFATDWTVEENRKRIETLESLLMDVLLILSAPTQAMARLAGW